MSSRIETRPRFPWREVVSLFGAAACLVLLVLPAGATTSRSRDGGSVVGTYVVDNYFLQLPAGAESVSAGDSLTGRHTWGINITNGTANALQGVAMQFDSDGSGNDYTDSNTFGFNFVFFTTDPNAFVSNHPCPTPSATQEVCPSPAVILPPNTGEVTLFTGPGSPVTTTTGYDATRTVTPIPASNDSAVSVAVTLQDSRYAGGTNIRVSGQNDNADPNVTPTVTAGGQPLPTCPPQTAGTPCAYTSDFGAYRIGSTPCESVSLEIANAEVGAQYVFGWDENESGEGCPTGEPAVSVLGFTGAAQQPPNTTQPCDAGTDCSVTQSIPGLGNVATIVGAGQGITGSDIGTGQAIYGVNFPPENTPAPPSGTESFDFGGSTTPDGVATATNDNTTASATGIGSLTVSEWGSDPVTSPPFMASGQYFDVEVLSGSQFTKLTLKDCNLGGGNTLQWWNGSAWTDVIPDSPPLAYDAGPPACLTGELSDASSPTLSELRGTIFAVTNAPVLSLAKNKLKLFGKQVTVRLGCVRAACRGTATLQSSATKKQPKTVVLGRAKYALGAGKSGNVRIALTSAGKKALAHVTRTRAYKSALSVTVAHGATLRKSVAITR